MRGSPLIAICAAAALLIGGCGGEGGDEESAAPAAVRFQIAGFRFIPENATVHLPPLHDRHPSR